MVVVQHRSKRKATGGRYKKLYRGKRIAEMGRHATMTHVGEKQLRSTRARGGHTKHFLLSAQEVNVMDPKTKKAKKVAIKEVTENAANPNFVRRNILTKGTIIETELGKARVTSRPGQEGGVNAVLI